MAFQRAKDHPNPTAHQQAIASSFFPSSSTLLQIDIIISQSFPIVSHRSGLFSYLLFELFLVVASALACDVAFSLWILDCHLWSFCVIRTYLSQFFVVFLYQGAVLGYLSLVHHVVIPLLDIKTDT